MRRFAFVVGALAALLLLGFLIAWQGSVPPEGVAARRGHETGLVDRLVGHVREQLGIEESTTGDLVLRVVDGESRSAVGDAKVALFRDEEWSEPLAHGTTDGDGVVRFENLRVACYHVARVEAEGFALEHNMYCRADPEPKVVEVELRRPARALGKALDAVTGAPIMGARIVSREGPGFLMHDEVRIDPGPRRHTTESGSDGRWSLPDLHGWTLLLAEADGYAPIRKLTWSHAEGEEIGLHFVPAGAVVGRVTDADGVAVAGARVFAAPLRFVPSVLEPGLFRLRSSLRCRWGDTGPSEDILGVLHARTDSGGRFRLEGLAVGEPHWIRAIADGLAPSRPHVATPMAAWGTSRIDLALHRGASLNLRMRCADGRAVRKPDLVLIPLSKGLPRATFEGDDEGIIRVEGLVPGTYRAEVSAAHCERHQFEIVLHDGKTLDRGFCFEPFGKRDPDEIVTVSGRVVDHAGVPVDGARVTYNRGEPGEIVTGADGAFAFRVSRRHYPEVSAEADGYFGWGESAWSILDEELTIVLSRLSSVRIPVSFPPGVQVPGEVDVHVSRERGGCSGAEPIEGGQIRLEIRHEPVTITLEVADLLPVSIRVELEPGEDRILPLVRFDRGATLAVLVTDEAGRPLAKADVSGWQSGEPDVSQDVCTDERGRATLLGLRADSEVRVSAWSTGYASGDATGIPSRAVGPLVMRLSGLVRLRGQVVDLRGHPVAFARIAARATDSAEDDPMEESAEADQAGRFSIWLEPGTYRLEFEAPGAGDGATTTLEIEVTRAFDESRRFVITRKNATVSRLR
jgi:Carboxypeptidase regulatory-like domain